MDRNEHEVLTRGRVRESFGSHALECVRRNLTSVGVCVRECRLEGRNAVCSQMRKRISGITAPVVSIGGQHSTEERNCGVCFRAEGYNRVGCLVSALLPVVVPKTSSAGGVLHFIVGSSSLGHGGRFLVIDPIQEERKSVCSDVPKSVVGPKVAFRGGCVIIVGQPLAQLASAIHRFGRGGRKQIKCGADKKQNGDDYGDESLPHRRDMP